MRYERSVSRALLLGMVLWAASPALAQEPGGGGGGGRPPQGGGGSRPPGGGQRPPSSGGAQGNTRPSPGGSPSQGGNRPSPGGGNNRPNPGGGNNRPNPGGGNNRPGRPQPSRPNPGGGRPPQWGQRPPNRPNYNFRPNNRDYLRHYYSRNLGYINMAHRPRFVMGGFFPWAYIQYITPVPPPVYGYLPPPPPGYQMGYYQGYVVVYDPMTYFIANVIDLMAQ